MQIKLNEQGLKEIEDKKLTLPFSSGQLDKSSMLKLFAEKSIHEQVVIENFGCLVMNLSEMSETLRVYNNYKKQLDIFFKNKFIIADPCFEITYYKWDLNRDDYKKENIHPILNKILDEADTKNYASVWLDYFEDKSHIVNFVEKIIDKQNILSVALPIVPLMEISSPNLLINLAFDINEEACSISQNLEKDYLGCYIPIHHSLLGNDLKARKKFKIIADKLVDLLRKYDNVYIYIKLIEIENLGVNYSIEKMSNFISFLESLNMIKGTDYINGNKFILQVSGVNKKFMTLIGKGADSVAELINGKTTIQKLGGFNVKNRGDSFMFGDFYNMVDQVMVSYDAIMAYFKKHKSLPSYTKCSKKVIQADLENFLTYAKIKRLNQIEARCIEIEQFKEDLIQNNIRGLQDRLARSTDEELQKLAKLF